MPNTIKTRSGRTLILNTLEEEAAIQRGIDQDPDNPEWTAEDFKKMRRLGDRIRLLTDEEDPAINCRTGLDAK